jgi:hypothetical protein
MQMERYQDELCTSAALTRAQCWQSQDHLLIVFRARIISLGKSKPKREQDSRTFYHTHNHGFRHDCLIEAFQIWPTERDQND